MKVIPLKKNGSIYTCNSYLILGDWNHIADINTLIDPGTDAFVIDEIDHLSTGLGKMPVEQIILTHNHFDHAGGVREIKKRYHAKVLAFSDGPDVDELLTDGQRVAAADGVLDVLHIQGHSSDSICLYSTARRSLFSGDALLNVRSPGGAFSSAYVKTLQRLSKLTIDLVYSGHDQPMTDLVRETILSTLANVRKSTIALTNADSRFVA